jgi:glutamyl-Q tRNA(Asp) synthetase
MNGAASAPFSVVGRKPLARFAPSPTGPLHLGSLLAAAGSYLDARAAGAGWLVRIEDLDTARVIPGCADSQLRTLEAFGFEWDGEVVYQSSRLEAHRAALAMLAAQGRTYRCSCSRKDLAGDGQDSGGYPGTCRNGPAKPGPTAVRFRVSDAPLHFDDVFLGPQQLDLASRGDFVVERRDGIPSYQLAVVVDDAWQGITRVVRGADLLSSTPWQIDLQRALGHPTPSYGHLPLVVEPDGSKLSKSNRALSLEALVGNRRPTDPTAVSRVLTSTLTLLSQRPPPDLVHLPAKDVWKWAIAHWRPQALAGRTEARVSEMGDS